MIDHNAYRRQITVKVCKNSCYDVPTKLWEAIAWFQEKLDQIPVECYDAATLDIVMESSDCAPVVTINYTRLETEEEFDGRRMKERAQKEVEREKEIKLLQNLKVKYPGV